MHAPKVRDVCPDLSFRPPSNQKRCRSHCVSPLQLPEPLIGHLVAGAKRARSSLRGSSIPASSI
jgi:hypothetical protein